MAKATKSENVPAAMQAKFTEISQLTDDVCKRYLNDEYAQYAPYLTAALCRKRPSPLSQGKAASWASGIVHALGMVNFLHDPSQTPHMKSADLYAAFGVSQSTGSAKSKQVRDLMNMHQMDSTWCLPSRLGDNLVSWLISVNGFIIDAREASRAIQVEAFRKGLIPYLPDSAIDDE
jgi:hypothetical protein